MAKVRADELGFSVLFLLTVSDTKSEEAGAVARQCLDCNWVAVTRRLGLYGNCRELTRLFHHNEHFILNGLFGNDWTNKTESRR